MNTARARARFVNDGLATLSGPNLLLALYRRLERDIDDAAAALAESAIEPAHGALLHAQEIVQELALALDPTVWSGAGQLADLYEWLSNELVRANITKDAVIVDACRQVITELHRVWAEASCAETLAS